MVPAGRQVDIDLRVARGGQGGDRAGRRDVANLRQRGPIDVRRFTGVLVPVIVRFREIDPLLAQDSISLLSDGGRERFAQSAGVCRVHVLRQVAEIFLLGRPVTQHHGHTGGAGFKCGQRGAFGPARQAERRRAGKGRCKQRIIGIDAGYEDGIAGSDRPHEIGIGAIAVMPDKDNRHVKIARDIGQHQLVFARLDATDAEDVLVELVGFTEQVGIGIGEAAGIDRISHDAGRAIEADQFADAAFPVLAEENDMVGRFKAGVELVGIAWHRFDRWPGIGFDDLRLHRRQAGLQQARRIDIFLYQARQAEIVFRIMRQVQEDRGKHRRLPGIAGVRQALEGRFRRPAIEHMGNIGLLRRARCLGRQAGGDADPRQFFGRPRYADGWSAKRLAFPAMGDQKRR